MTTPATEPTKRNPRQFGRTYDYETGIATVSAAFDSEFKMQIALQSCAQNVLQAFVLQACTDYVVNEGNEALREVREGESEADRRNRALGVMADAVEELKTGNLDFRTGSGIGGMRSAIGLLGQALFDLGKRFVKDKNGNKLEFTDVHGARDAVKALYIDTQPKGPFVPVMGADGKQEKTASGEPKVKAASEASHLTGRMIFNAISESEAVKAKLIELAPKVTRTTTGDDYTG